MHRAHHFIDHLGQSLWLDNLPRDLINNGILKRYIDEPPVTELTSNPTIFDHAIKNSTAYDAAVRAKIDEGTTGDDLFFEMALEDLTRANVFGNSKCLRLKEKKRVRTSRRLHCECTRR